MFFGGLHAYVYHIFIVKKMRVGFDRLPFQISATFTIFGIVFRFCLWRFYPNQGVYDSIASQPLLTYVYRTVMQSLVTFYRYIPSG